MQTINKFNEAAIAIFVYYFTTGFFIHFPHWRFTFFQFSSSSSWAQREHNINNNVRNMVFNILYLGTLNVPCCAVVFNFFRIPFFFLFMLNSLPFERQTHKRSKKKQTHFVTNVVIELISTKIQRDNELSGNLI